MTKKTKLSVAISAYNEEAKIEDCLRSVSFADEVILIDNTSSDATIQIGKKLGAKVFMRPNNRMLNVNKNFGFTKATGDWILCLDADERVTPELRREIQESINKEQFLNGFWIPRKNIIFNKWIQNSIWWPDYQLRLFKKGYGRFPEKHVHEYITVEGQTEKLTMPLIHENYSSVSQFLYKLDKIYTESEVENYLLSGKHIEWWDALRFPIKDFIKTYFAEKGYKDGLHGLVLSMLQAFYAEVVFAKIWEKQGFQEHAISLNQISAELKRGRGEVDYWINTAFLEEEKNIIRKLKHRLFRKRALKDTR